MNIIALFYMLICLIGFLGIYLAIKKIHSEKERTITEILSELSIILSAILFGFLFEELIGTNISFLIPALLLLFAGITLRILSR